jgi:hypothetical protein
MLRPRNSLSTKLYKYEVFLCFCDNQNLQQVVLFAVMDNGFLE